MTPAQFLLASVAKTFQNFRFKKLIPVLVEDPRSYARVAQLSIIGAALVALSYFSYDDKALPVQASIHHLLAFLLFLVVPVMRKKFEYSYRVADWVFFSALAFGIVAQAWLRYHFLPQSSNAMVQVLMAYAFVLLIYPLGIAFSCYLLGGALSLVFLLMSHWLVGRPDGFHFMHVPMLLVNILGMTAFKVYADRSMKDKTLAARAITQTLAHEMRTPILSIQASCKALSETFGRFMTKMLSPTQLESRYAQLAIKSVHDGLDRIEGDTEGMQREMDLLLYNVSAPTTLPPDTKIVLSMAGMVEQCLVNYPFFHRTEFQLIDLHTQDDFSVKLSPFLFQHVFTNLMKNALYSISEAGKGRISITLVQNKQKGRNLLIFRDDGIGIDKTHLANIFAPFYTTRKNGTGLGLNFCRRALNLMDATISVSSVKGEFTEFTLSFPYVSTNRPYASDISSDDNAAT